MLFDVHVVCKISNLKMWTPKHLAQASFTELTLALLDQNGNEDSESLNLTEFDAVQFCMKHTDQLHIIQGTCSTQWS